MLQRIVTILAAVTFLAVAYFLLRDELDPATEEASAPAEEARAALPDPAEPVAPAEVAEPAPREPVAPPPPSPAPAAPLPALDESDPFVRERLAAFDLPATWVAQQDLVRRLAVFLDNATRGEMARRWLRFLTPAVAFRVVERDGRVFADPENARRFDPIVDRLGRIDPNRAAALVAELEPLLDEAVAALGSPEASRDVLLEAIDRMLDAPDPVPDAELIRPKVFYEYADPGLESLAPLEKQLMRLGPRNLDRLKAWLARFDRSLRNLPRRP